MTRSLLITFDYPPAVGGIARVLERFYRLAGHAGCAILAPSAPGAADFDRSHPVRTLRFPAPRAGALGKVVTLVAAAVWATVWLLRQRPDLVVAGQAVRAGPLAWLWSRLARRPFDLWVYGGETSPRFTPWRPFTGFLQRRVLRGARTVFTNSPYTTREMTAFGLDPRRVVELPLGVDRDLFHPGEPDAELVARHGLEGRLVFLTVGRLIERKGVDRMLGALAAVRGQLPPWSYLVVGDGPYRAALQQLAARLGVAADVVFTGFVESGDLPRYYRTCDVFAMPNREVASPSSGGSLSVEGFGLVFLEAAACGKPVIAGRSGGAVHAVDEGVTGLLVDGDDLESLGSALKALADPARREAMGAAGVEFAARFDWARSAAVLARYL